MYVWEGKDLDPNAVIPLCRVCDVAYHLFWDEMRSRANKEKQDATNNPTN